MIIAIDGPAGSGKSTIAKRVAAALQINYLDTGAMYRVVTLYMLEAGIDPAHQELVCQNIENVQIDIIAGEFYLNNQNVNQEIRTPEVTRNVSLIAAYQPVRAYLVKLQKAIGTKNSCILDGRDIGSVVFPQADFKFFLTATPQIRAHRRFLETKNQPFAQSEQQILTEIIERDRLDSTRSESPLIKAQDAIEIDTTNLNIDQVVALIIKTVK